MKRKSIYLASLLTACPATLDAAPGDVIKRLPVLAPCTLGIVGLTFDGTTLYCTLRDVAVAWTVFKIEAATGADSAERRGIAKAWNVETTRKSEHAILSGL